jgi:hypothetical protein
MCEECKEGTHGVLTHEGRCMCCRMRPKSGETYVMVVS